MTSLMSIRMRYDLSASLAKILILLIRHKVVTTVMIENEFKLTKDAKVAIHRLRRRLDAQGIEIKSMRDVGYWIEDESRKDILDATRAHKEELPLGDEGDDV